MTTTRRAFPDVSSLTWEHPLDAAALQALRKIPGFDLALRKIFGLFAERTIRLISLGSSIEVGPEQYPKINRVYEEVLETLNAPERYQLFLSQTPVVNAGAVGMDRPFIVLTSSITLLMKEDELRYVLGHEVGHILSGHVLYKTMLKLLVEVSRLAFSNPLSGFAYMAVMMGLMEWDRKSELSADRAGLLAAQDPDVVRKALLKMAGGVDEGANVQAFQAQSRRYHEDGDTLDAIAKTLTLLGRTHPFPVQRVRELDLWIEGGDYERVLRGDYPRRSQDPPGRDDPWNDWKQSAASYAEGIKTSTEPVTSWVKEVGNSAADTASGLMAKVKGRMTEALKGKDGPVDVNDPPDDA